VDKDYWLGTYEPDLQSAMHKLIPAEAVVYDVGANIGYVSLLLARSAGEKGKVYAFEALPSNVDQLRRNVELNGMGARITVVPKAVTQVSGPVCFLVHASGQPGGKTFTSLRSLWMEFRWMTLFMGKATRRRRW
jgi:hypothetical protein